MHVLKSTVPEIVWPAIPAARSQMVLSMLFQLEQSQWWLREELEVMQMRQLSKLMAHAGATVPYYKALFADLGITASDDMALRHWDKLPILPRQVLQERDSELHSEAVPKSMQPTGEVRTAGSSGRPVTVKKPALEALIYQALTLRHDFWHRRDFRTRLATIRLPSGNAGPKPEGPELYPIWSSVKDAMYGTAGAGLLDVRNSMEDQVAWLEDFDPAYLLTYPSNAVGLAQYMFDKGIKLPSLKQITTLSETLTPVQREQIEAGFNVPVADIYSAQEVGYIALQAPGYDHYLVQSEGVYVEVIGEDGKPCAPGEVGRVIVTPLHNFAQPLLRYDIGDMAELGESCCPTGRGLPVLKRIVGRVRNLVTTPEGKRFWPGVGDARYHEVAPIKQFQFVQTSLQDIEAHFVCPRAVTAEEEARLKDIILARMGYPFTLHFKYPDEIPRLANGKFEDFRSELTPEEVAKAGKG